MGALVAFTIHNNQARIVFARRAPILKSCWPLNTGEEKSMPITFDPQTDEFTYEGRTVGTLSIEDGVATVKLDVTYTCDAEDWMAPLSWFAVGLRQLPKHQEPKVHADADLEVETDEASIAEEYDVPRLLTEQTIRAKGYVWRFHKSDADHWPSPLHGHDYEKKLKLDAITGDIYDTATRHKCKKLRSKDLVVIQSKLRESNDFVDKVNQLIDG